MDLYLQFGYGMMGHSEHLIKKWGGGTVVLSPRDLEVNQMVNLSKKLAKDNGTVLIDPQFYAPRANHERLISHSFWPDDEYQTSLFNTEKVRQMLLALKNDYNDVFETSYFILPATKISEIDEDWYNYNNMIVSAAGEINITQPILHTLCFSKEVLSSENQMHDALEYIETWKDIDGFYVVPEPSNNSYLIDDPNWLVNLIDFCSGVNRLGKKVVVGYCHHQHLCLALAKVDAICSGTWLNVRSFNANKFHKKEEDSASRRTTWYYCPQALSEYQIRFLDLAQRIGRLDELKTDLGFNSAYVDPLFSGAQPSTVNFGEKEAFRHYLQCLKIQVASSVKDSYAETRSSLKIQLETADRITAELNQAGIRGRDRDFSNVVDINHSAIDVFHQQRGMLSEHTW